MPFNFLKRGKDEPEVTPDQAGPPPGARAAPFAGLTEEWRLRGMMHIDGRLSDALNKREAIAISDVSWAPIDGSQPFTPVPGLKSVDPYDLIIVLAGDDTLPEMTDDERGAHKIHKVQYDVALDAPPFRIIGTVHLYPGTEPQRLLDRSSDMFVAVTDAVATLGEGEVGDPQIDVILVNRFYLRGVDQIDRRTRERVQPQPGQPLGGLG